MMRKLTILYVFALLLPLMSFSQTVKILFDCTKAETASNADWVIDADLHNIDWESTDVIGTGTASNPQRYPTPAQSTVTSSTPENYWEGALSAWGIDCVKYGYEVETLTPHDSITYGNTTHAQDLMNYKVYVVDEPNIKFTIAERTAIINFVKNGGGLMMISDHNNSDRNNDGWDSPNIWNNMMDTIAPVNPFGITFDLDYFSPASTNVSTNTHDSLTNGPYGAVTQLTFSGATIMHIWPNINSTATGDIWMDGVSQSSHDSIMFAHAHFGAGKVAAISDSSPEDDGTGNPACSLYVQYTTGDGGSDRKLFMNAIIWLAESPTTVVTTDSLRLLTTADTILCSGSSVTMSAAGSTSYSWSPGGATTAGITVQPASSGLYIVAGTTSGTTKYDTVKVTIDAFSTTTPQITAGGPVAFCAPGSVTLTAPAESGYHWSNGSTTQSVSPTQSGTYTVSLTDANGCKATSNSVTVTADAFAQTTPQITAGGPLTFCGNSSVTLTAPSQTSYQWSNGLTTQSITVNQTGSYTASITDANGCQATSNAVSVSADAFSQTEPQISANGPLAFCTGGNVVLSAPAGYTYHWNNNSTQQTVTVTQTGIFSLTVTDANNCSAKSDTAWVSVSANITGVQISPAGALTFCTGNSISLSAPSGYTSYNWSTGSASQSISVSQQGQYYVSVSSGNNCNGVSDTSVVSADAFSTTTPQLSASGPLAFCQGGNVIISGSVPGATYNWSNNTQQTSITVAQTGIYNATITDANNCSAISQSLTVLVNALPQVSLTASADSVCSVGSPIQLNGTPAGGTYTGTAISGSEFEPSVSGVGNFAVNYHYTDNNGCTDSAGKSLTVYICTGIETISENAVSVYPNPSSGGFIFETTQGFAPDAVKVFDGMGRQVMTLTNTGNQNQIKLNLQGYASGVYIAVFTKDNDVVRKKLVKTE
jgi:hypothetical protein